MSIFNTSAKIIFYGTLRDNNCENNNPKIESDHLNAQFFSEICFREISWYSDRDDCTNKYLDWVWQADIRKDIKNSTIVYFTRFSGM